MPAGVFIVMVENTIAAFGLFRSKFPRGGPLMVLGYFAALLYTPVHFTLMTIMGYAGVSVKWKGERVEPKVRGNR
jgi:hypothetical protein